MKPYRKSCNLQLKIKSRVGLSVYVLSVALTFVPYHYVTLPPPHPTTQWLFRAATIVNLTITAFVLNPCNDAL